MSEIFDNEGNLLGLIIKSNSISDEKYFATKNSQEMQVAAFNLKKNTKIDNHIHIDQKREINSTSEVIVVLEGLIKINIFDKDLNLITSEELTKGDTVALFQGGHGIEVIEDAKFVEAKQGPYLEDMDKKRF